MFLMCSCVNIIGLPAPNTLGGDGVYRILSLDGGGLRGIPGGLERLKANQVSGVKLVARPQETI